APWRVVDFTTMVRKHGAAVQAEATVKVEVGDEVYHTAASGNGPVNALDAALRKALIPSFPALKGVRLLDYKVRILDGGAGTAARGSSTQERAAEHLVASWSVERAEQVARAFTCYFHLANLAEEHHRARVLRERDHGPEPLPESLAATTRQLSRQLGRRRMQELVKRLEVHPVFTAHPTEARRRAVVTAIRRVGDQLDRVN